LKDASRDRLGFALDLFDPLTEQSWAATMHLADTARDSVDRRINVVGRARGDAAAGRDGVLRRYSFLRDDEPSLALAAYLARRDVPWESVEKSPKHVSWDELAANLETTERREIGAAPVLLNFRSG
jgi:hypothetical protein